MITITNITNNIIELKANDKIKEDDFLKVSSAVKTQIEQHGSINLLIDASDLAGWESFSALKEHLGFVKEHHKNVNKIAMIPPLEFLRYFVFIAELFVDPEILAFSFEQIQEARAWLMS